MPVYARASSRRLVRVLSHLSSPSNDFDRHTVWSSGCRLFARETAATESLAVTRAMRAIRLLVLALALALAPLHAHADRGNYLRCVSFVPPRGFRVPRPPFPSVALRRSMRSPTEFRDETLADVRRAHVCPSPREHRPRRSHDASRATETRAPALVPACPVATDTPPAPNRFSRTPRS